MFGNLTQRLSKTIRNLTGKGHLSAENIQDALREVRVALLEADVALPVVKDFLEQVRVRAIGQEVMQSLSPDQAFIKIVHDELINTIGGAAEAPLNLATQPPAVILMAGLQGSGKTTTAAKLAKLLQERQQKKVLLASCDIYRPAAIEQLGKLAQQINAHFHQTVARDPVAIAAEAIDAAKRQFIDVVIIDTAGRLHIDDAMMQEIKQIHAAIRPIETLFVVDSMTGQDAANTAKAFNDALPLTGVILTKTDGDARGGAALSIRAITGKPIKYLGIGEKLDALEAFYAERIASRILGMGDVLSLIEEAERKIDKKEADKLAQKLKKGKTFDLGDFREQLKQMSNMGGIGSLMDKLPGMGNLAKMAQQKMSDKTFGNMGCIIDSMTPHERRFPAVINGSRKRRIALGSGTQIQDVNRLLKQFTQMQKMFKKFSKGGMQKMMRSVQGMLPGGGSGLPPL